MDCSFDYLTQWLGVQRFPVHNIRIVTGKFPGVTKHLVSESNGANTLRTNGLELRLATIKTTWSMPSFRARALIFFHLSFP